LEIVASVLYDGGPVVEWDWDWETGAYDVNQSDSDYESTSWGKYSSTGIYDVTVQAWDEYYQDSRASVDVYVIDVNLGDGGYVALNDDDDDDSGWPDKDDIGPVIDENDLVQLSTSISPPPYTLRTGYVILKALSGSDKIRVWYDSEKNNEITLPTQWYVVRGFPPSSVWVEGIAVSSEPNDVVLELSFKPYYEPTLDAETAEFTVLNVQITEPDGDPNYDNEFAFDSNTPGVCDVNATGTTGISSLNADLEWTLEDISDPCTTLTAVPDPCVGPSVTFTYTGLPSSNSQFGEKTLTLEHGPSGFQDTRTIEIFFVPDANNHPGEGAGTSPNWFYYWKEGGVVSDLASENPKYDFEWGTDPRYEGFCGLYDARDDTLYVYGGAAHVFDPPRDPIDTDFENIYYNITIRSGRNGIANTTAIPGDDIQVIPWGEGDPNTIAITAGTNGTIESDPEAVWWSDDKKVEDPTLGWVIITGRDGQCQTDRVGDDEWMIYTVGEEEIEMAFLNGKPYTTIITGSDEFLHTMSLGLGDDEFDLSGVKLVPFYNDSEGIYLCATTCTHELEHQKFYDMVREPGGPPYSYERGRDFDYVDDDYEINSTPDGYCLDPDRSPTYFCQHPEFPDVLTNDHEFLAYVAQQNRGSVDPSKDWSKGGEQWEQ
jgi:hypothetical protein